MRQNLHNLLKFQGLYASGKLGSARKTRKNTKNCDLETEIRRPGCTFRPRNRASPSLATTSRDNRNRPVAPASFHVPGSTARCRRLKGRAWFCDPDRDGPKWVRP